MEEFNVAMSTDYVNDVDASFNNAYDLWGEVVSRYRSGEISVNQIQAAYKCVTWLEGILSKKIKEFDAMTESRLAEDPGKHYKIKKAMSKKNTAQLVIAQNISEVLVDSK